MNMAENNLKSKIAKVSIFILQLILAISFLYPLYYMFINSFKTRAEYGLSPFGFPKWEIGFSNYVTMISQFKILNLFKNTFIIGVATIVLILVFGMFASYSFAKLKFRGQKAVYMGIIITLFVPAQVTMIPMYVMFSKVNLINNFWSVILSYLAIFLPEAIMLMTSNFKSIPDEMLEAAEMDGCKYFQTVRNVIIPMGKPAIILTIIFYFIIIWNDLFTPMILLQKMEARTVMVALATLMARYSGDPPFQFAGLMLSAIPAILVYMVFQRHIIKGMTVGAIK
jgi:ABC-type sugar transport system, permease component